MNKVAPPFKDPVNHWGPTCLDEQEVCFLLGGLCPKHQQVTKSSRASPAANIVLENLIRPLMDLTSSEVAGFVNAPGARLYVQPQFAKAQLPCLDKPSVLSELAVNNLGRDMGPRS